MASRNYKWKDTIEYQEDENEDEEEEEDDDDDDDDEEVDHQYVERRVHTTRSGGGGAGRSTMTPPCCQADDCNAILSNARPYHRRHKVCEFHAKAPVVLLAGLDQRFCQQCSRFHVVSEFDESKRSCRRRLAGHNERRRKSFPDFHGQTSSS